jgi:hypothetical protein
MADQKEPMQTDGRGMPPDDAEESPSAGRPDMAENAGQSGGGAYPNPYDRKGGNPEDDRGFHGGQSIQGYFGGDQLGDEELGENANAPSEED